MHSALIDSDIDLNKQMIKVIDIQETQEVEICIPWAAQRGWMRTLAVNNTEGMYGSSFDAVNNSVGYVNGYIGVVAFTDVQSPDDSAVPVNVYVSCDDLHVNAITQFPLARIMSESGNLESDVAVSCVPIGSTGASDDWISMHHFGEEPVSFRPLLKRFCHTNGDITAAGNATHLSANMESPIYPNIVPAYGGTTQSSSLYSYLRYAYLGVRGSMRKRVHFTRNPSGSNNGYWAGIILRSPGVSQTSNFSWSTGTVQLNMRGSNVYVLDTNGGVECELPFYSNNLFAFSCANDLTGTFSNGEFENFWFRNYIYRAEINNPSAGDIEFVEASAVGEDFMFLRFLGAPMYSY
jgi:hypothetical protein